MPPTPGGSASSNNVVAIGSAVGSVGGACLTFGILIWRLIIAPRSFSKRMTKLAKRMPAAIAKGTDALDALKYKAKTDLEQFNALGRPPCGISRAFLDEGDSQYRLILGATMPPPPLTPPLGRSQT